jgi:flagellar biosynthesis/type III secretory pathway protein FliH
MTATLNKIPQTEQTEEYVMTLIETWRQRGYEKGVAEGIEQGIEQGMKAKSTALIAKQLKLKFSSESDIWIEKLATFNLQQLEMVAERILFSDSLPEIFDGLVH